MKQVQFLELQGRSTVTFAGMFVFIKYETRTAGTKVGTRGVDAMVVAVQLFVPIFTKLSSTHFFTFISVCNTQDISLMYHLYLI